MQQVWLSMSIPCESEQAAIERAQIVDRSDKTKDVVVEGNVVKYKQLTWQDGYNKEDLDD